MARAELNTRAKLKAAAGALRGLVARGPVAQWQSTGLITPGSQVRILPGLPNSMYPDGGSKQRVTHAWRRQSLTDTNIVKNAEDVSRELALKIADLIADSPASDTVVLDIRELSTISDFFVICSGENERQLRAIVNDVREGLEKVGIFPRRSDEGSTASGWLLIDYGDVIVHVLDVEQRSFYRLEELWADAPTLLAIE